MGEYGILQYSYLHVTVCIFVFGWVKFTLIYLKLANCAFSLDLNAAESGVQHKPAAGRQMNALHTDQQANQEKCSC